MPKLYTINVYLLGSPYVFRDFVEQIEFAYCKLQYVSRDNYNVRGNKPLNFNCFIHVGE